VYAAMLARGFSGEVRTYAVFRMRGLDWAALLLTCVVAGLTVPLGRIVA
jgi:energy-coupling factor transporter transmembrane protein EcfT